MKKNSPKPRKQKKKRPKVVGWQDRSIRPGTGSILASKVWGGIKRAQPGHQERTTTEMWNRAEQTPFFYPEYDVFEVTGQR